MADKQDNHGGARPGSGRPPEHPEGVTVPITITVPASLLIRLDKLTTGNRSAAVTEAIRHEVERLDQETD
jgi:hypothetical protein